MSMGTSVGELVAANMTPAQRAALAASPTDHSTKAVINTYNLQMRNQPWYQDWFRARGLNPNNVKLSKPQRQELEQQVVAHGAPSEMFNDLMIDPAGNLNHEHGFASQPTWLKALEIGGAAAAGGYFAAPAFGASAAAVPETTLGSTVIGAGGVPVAATAASAAAPAVTGAVGGGFSLSGALAKATPSLINAGVNLYGQHAQISAADRAATIQSEAAKYAADRQAEATAAALAFQQSQAAQDARVAETTRHANYDQWAAGQHRLQSVGDLLGKGPREIPAYVPLPVDPTMAPGSVGAMTSGNTIDMVMMTAPDGSRKAVPRDQVAHYTQKGARVIG